MSFKKIISVSISVFLIGSCSSKKDSVYSYVKNYKPNDLDLYQTIIKMDSSFFEAYNTCDTNIEKYASFYSESVEFYHDQGGKMTSKKELVASTKEYVCGKVTRELIPGSIEVYPIKNYGAIEIGLHRFRNNTEPAGTPSQIGRFVIIWQKENSDWKIARVVSLH
jgi:ketosteroid isomerase-like protein